jgi:hypothetical protein
VSDNRENNKKIFSCGCYAENEMQARQCLCRVPGYREYPPINSNLWNVRKITGTMSIFKAAEDIQYLFTWSDEKHDFIAEGQEMPVNGQ